MKTILLVALAATSAFARPVSEYKDAFVSWVQTHEKAYPVEEFPHRFAAFSSNLDYVESFNAENNGVTLEMNKFADLTSEEFNSIYLGLNFDMDVYTAKPKNVATFSKDVAIPDSVDWRTQGAVSHVKDQGQCGSCWSFSTTGSVEGQWKLSNHTLVPLSEQNLVDCSTAQGNAGCNGGLMDDAFTYIISNKGIDTEASYPYTAADGKECKFNKANIGATISSYKDIPSKNETALTMAAATVGPISVAIDASHSSFQLYKSGVYHQLLCSQTRLDHGVLVVGYGTDSDSGSDYYIVKNSWGASWGLQGYLWMSRNRNNNCGIATSASYPVV